MDGEKDFRMGPDKPSDGYIQFPSSAEGLEVRVKDQGSTRKIIFRGAHVVWGGDLDLWEDLWRKPNAFGKNNVIKQAMALFLN
jgi:hypothetical protein